MIASSPHAAGVAQIKRKPLSDWLNSRLFSLVHQHNLVYNICWEDPRLDRVALAINSADHILVITSAGCNALDYALQEPERIYAVDMNPRQNALLELKIAGIDALGFSEFFELFGLGGVHDFKSLYQEKLRERLTPWTQNFWDRNTCFFERSRRSFYFRGSSGYFARLTNIYIDHFAKIRTALDALLEAASVEEQREIYEKQIREIFWSGPLRKFLSSNTALSMVGVPRPQRQQVELHFGRGIAEFIEYCIESVFACLPIRDNYFWRVYIKGEFSRECCPEYLKEENFYRLKNGLASRISICTNSVEGFLRSHTGRISKFVLLDHMDWLSTFRYPLLVNEWQAIANRAAEDSRVIFRSGGMKVEYVDPIQIEVNGRLRRLGNLLNYHQELANELHQKCRVHTYGSFYIADLQPA